MDPCLHLEQSLPSFYSTDVCFSDIKCTVQMCLTYLREYNLTCYSLCLEYSSHSYLDRTYVLSWFLLSYPFLQTAILHVSSYPLQICTMFSSNMLQLLPVHSLVFPNRQQVHWRCGEDVFTYLVNKYLGNTYFIPSTLHKDRVSKKQRQEYYLSSGKWSNKTNRRRNNAKQIEILGSLLT